LAAVVLALAAVPTGGRAAYDAEASVRAPATDVPWARASIVLVAFACYTAAEIGPGAWGYAYLVDHRHLGATAAAVMVALFWVFLTAGRIALGMFGERLDSARVLAGSCGLFVLGVGLLWAGPNGVASLAMSLAGVSCAAVFPVLVNVTPAAVGAGAAHRVVGYSIAAAALGGPLAVLGEGLAANRYGVSSLAPAMTLLAILLLVPIAVLLTVLRQPLSDLSARQ
jgi:fucose permease